jgi:Protein of unknown function (DUF4240)
VNTDDVWNLIEQARTDRARTGDDVADALVRLLAQRPPAEILTFDQPLWELLAVSYRADLWAAAYLINGGASDDGFEYFRGWLIAQGRAVFERALADPNSLAAVPAVRAAADEGDELEDEDVLRVVWTAYRSVTGQEPPSGNHSIRLPDIAFDFDFDDEAEMSRRLPRLSALYDE